MPGAPPDRLDTATVEPRRANAELAESIDLPVMRQHGLCKHRARPVCRDFL